MAGCYGNHPEDKYFERQLNRYLDKQCEDDNKEEWIEERKNELLKDEWSFKHSNIVEAMCNLPDFQEMTLTSFIAAYKDLPDNPVSRCTLADYLVKVISDYLEDGAKKQAEKDYDSREDI
jgi:hypothetical protein